MKQRKVKLVNVRHGVNDRSKFIYAELVDAESGNSLIWASLAYILEAIEKRNYRLVA